MLGARLSEREKVVMASREVADVESGTGEGRAANHLPLRNEAISDSPLIEHLDRAQVTKTAE